MWWGRKAMYCWGSRSCWILNLVSRKSCDTCFFQLDASSTGNVLSTEASGTNESAETLFSSDALSPSAASSSWLASEDSSVVPSFSWEQPDWCWPDGKKNNIPGSGSSQDFELEGWSFSTLDTVILMHKDSFLLWSGFWLARGTSSSLIPSVASGGNSMAWGQVRGGKGDPTSSSVISTSCVLLF